MELKAFSEALPRFVGGQIKTRDITGKQYQGEIALAAVEDKILHIKLRWCARLEDDQWINVPEKQDIVLRIISKTVSELVCTLRDLRPNVLLIVPRLWISTETFVLLAPQVQGVLDPHKVKGLVLTA